MNPRRFPKLLLPMIGAALLAGCTHEKTAEEVVRPAPRELPSVSLPAVEQVTPPPLPAIPPSPEQIAAAWKEGTALFDARDYAHAVLKLETAASGRPDDPYAHYLLGLARWKDGRPREAEQALARAGELGPDSIKTWVNLARVRLDLDEAAAALEAAERALEIDPLSADAMHQQGRALAGLGRSELALEALRQAQAAAPANGYIANTLGYHLIQAGLEAEAIPLLEAARDCLPEVAYVRNNLGVAYERTGRADEAVAEYRAAVAAGDSAGKAATSLARLRVPLEPAEAPLEDVEIASVAARPAETP